MPYFGDKEVEMYQGAVSITLKHNFFKHRNITIVIKSIKRNLYIYKMNRCFSNYFFLVQ